MLKYNLVVFLKSGELLVYSFDNWDDLVVQLRLTNEMPDVFGFDVRKSYV